MIGQYTKADGTKHDFTYYTDIPTAKKISLVSSVVNMLMSGGMYNGIAKDLFFKYELIRAFTDVDVDISEQADAIGYMEDIVFGSDIAQIVIDNSAPLVIESLKKAVDDNITYKTGIQTHPIENAIAEFITSDAFKDAVVSTLNNISSKMSQLDMNALSGFMNKIKDMPLDFTPDKVIEAYMNTDMFKANQEEREKIITFHKEQGKVNENEN